MRRLRRCGQWARAAGVPGAHEAAGPAPLAQPLTRTRTCTRAHAHAQVVIAYDPEDTELFIEVADAIEAAWPSAVVEGNEDGPGAPGAFEVAAPGGGAPLFSRPRGAARPSAADVLSAIRARAAGGLGPGRGAGPQCG